MNNSIIKIASDESSGIGITRLKISIITRMILAVFLSAFISSCFNADDQRFFEYQNGSILQDIDISSNQISFMAIGDSGRGDAGQQAVSDAMSVYHGNSPVDFILLCGDNFYNNGVNSVSDPLFDSYFRNIYSTSNLDLKFYTVLGNHDHYGNAVAQIEYEDPDNRWVMDSLFYSFSCVLQDMTKIQFFMIDSYVIDEGYAIADYEISWLKDQLQNSTADYKIVVAHHPLYSSGSHGSSPYLQSVLKDLFIDNNVDIFISGHDHHLEILDAGFLQIITGAASDNLRAVNPISESLYAESILGFAVIHINSTQITVEFVDSSNNSLYSASF